MRRPGQGRLLGPVQILPGDIAYPEVRNNWRLEGATRDRVERTGVRWRTQQM